MRSTYLVAARHDSAPKQQEFRCCREPASATNPQFQSIFSSATTFQRDGRQTGSCALCVTCSGSSRSSCPTPEVQIDRTVFGDGYSSGHQVLKPWLRVLSTRYIEHRGRQRPFSGRAEEIFMDDPRRRLQRKSLWWLSSPAAKC